MTIKGNYLSFTSSTFTSTLAVFLWSLVFRFKLLRISQFLVSRFQEPQYFQCDVNQSSHELVVVVA